MKWDKKGAVKALKAEKCSVCEQVKEIHVVVTMHGKQDLHFPCCSSECQDTLQQIMFEESIKRF